MPADRAIQSQLVGCVRRGALVEYPGGVLCLVNLAGQNTIEATATQAGRWLVRASIQAEEAAGSAIGEVAAAGDRGGGGSGSGGGGKAESNAGGCQREVEKLLLVS